MNDQILENKHEKMLNFFKSKGLEIIPFNHLYADQENNLTKQRITTIQNTLQPHECMKGFLYFESSNDFSGQFLYIYKTEVLTTTDIRISQENKQEVFLIPSYNGCLHLTLSKNIFSNLIDKIELNEYNYSIDRLDQEEAFITITKYNENLLLETALTPSIQYINNKKYYRLANDIFPKEKIGHFTFNDTGIEADIHSTLYNTMEMDYQHNVVALDFHDRIKKKLYLKKLNSTELNLNDYETIQRYISDGIDLLKLGTDKDYDTRLTDKKFEQQKNALKTIIQYKKEIENNNQIETNIQECLKKIENSIIIKEVTFESLLKKYDENNFFASSNYMEQKQLTNLFHFLNTSFSIESIMELANQSEIIMNKALTLKENIKETMKNIQTINKKNKP